MQGTSWWNRASRFGAQGEIEPYEVIFEVRTMPKTVVHNSRREFKGDRAKRTYTSPRLIEYGSVKKLTAGVNGSNFDPGKEFPTKHGSG